MDRRYKARWRAGFRGKSRVVTGGLSDARVIGDRLFLSIENSASSFFFIHEIFIYFISISLDSIDESSILFLL